MNNINKLNNLKDQLAELEYIQLNNPPEDELFYKKNEYNIKQLKGKIAELELEVNFLEEQTDSVGTQVDSIATAANDISSQLDLVVSYPQLNDKRKQKLKNKYAILRAKKEELATAHSVAESKKLAGRHPKASVFGEANINRIEVETLIFNYFRDNFGIPVTIANNKIYLPSYANRTEEDIAKLTKYDKIIKDLTKLIESECDIEVELWPTMNGYNIYNVYDNLVIGEPANLFENKQVVTEVTKQEIGQEVSDSNIVLDNKFIWVFAVLDKYSDTIQDNIFNLDEAIGVFVENEPKSVILVAYPYVDPNPEDPAVDLVFADNPGPTIIFNNEKATKEKEQAEEELADEELNDIEQGRESLDKAQLDESTKVLLENTTVLQYIKYLKKTYDAHVDNPNYKREKLDENGDQIKDRQGRQVYVTHLDDLKDEVGAIVKAGKIDEVLQAVVDLAKVATDKIVKEYLVNFGKQLNQLSKQARVMPNNVGRDNLDELAKRAGLTESTITKLNELSIEQLKKQLYTRRKKHSELISKLDSLKQKDRTNENLKKIYASLQKYDKEADIIFNEILARGKQDDSNT